MSSKAQQLVHRISYWMTPLYERMPASLFPQYSRKFHAYCLGTPKSGTVSLGELFKTGYRSAHEPEVRFLTYKIMAWQQGKLGKDELLSYLRHRDSRMQLEMDSSYLNFEVAGELAQAFPQARFILTIRDCLSWLDSFINFQLNKPEFMGSGYKQIFRDHMDGLLGAGKYQHGEEEAALEELGLHSLDGYFSYWSHHNQHVMDTVPDEQLLIIRTCDINHSIPAIESFLGLPASTLPEAKHANPVTRRNSILDKVDKDYLYDKARLHCTTLMDRFFPGTL